MSTAGGFGKALTDGAEIGCTAVQIFTTSPRMWKAAIPSEAKIAEFKAASDTTGIRALVSHDSYLINLADADDERRTKSFNGLKGECERAAGYGIPYVVSHMGAHMGQGPELGLQRVAEAATRLLSETPETVTLLMETTAGQGTCLNSTFEELATVLEACDSHPRLAVCLDTCHIFAAGYDLRTDEAFDETFARFASLIGFDRLKVVHCNDSKKKLGTRVDRHANLGEGEIGAHAFQRLVNDARFEQIPIIVETPMEDDGHCKNVAKLWEWSGRYTS